VLSFLEGSAKNPVSWELSSFVVSPVTCPPTDPGDCLGICPFFIQPLRWFTLQSQLCHAVITVIEQTRLFSFFMHLRCSKKENKSRWIRNKLQLSTQNMHLYQENYRVDAAFILHLSTNWNPTLTSQSSLIIQAAQIVHSPYVYNPNLVLWFLVTEQS
jgi:hypothetical protein